MTKAIVLLIDTAAAPRIPEKQTYDYVRHGTTTLFATLEIATGKVTDACYPRHCNEESLRRRHHCST